MDVCRILKEREDRRALLEKEVGRILAQLRSLGAVKVILFGSTAQGETNVQSDLDFLIVMPGERGFSYWSRRLYEEIRRDVAADFLVYSEREFAEVVKYSRLVRHALRTGKVLYERPA